MAEKKYDKSSRKYNEAHELHVRAFKRSEHEFEVYKEAAMHASSLGFTRMASEEADQAFADSKALFKATKGAAKRGEEAWKLCQIAGECLDKALALVHQALEVLGQ